MALGFAFGRQDNGGSNTTFAGAGTAQATATALGTSFVNTLTTAVGETAFVLPAKLQSPCIAINTSATAALLFPPSGGKINGGSADASFSVAQSKPVWVVPHPNGLDYTVVLSA